MLCLLSGADGSYTCSRCHRLFTKLRQFTSHKCPTVSDSVNERTVTLADCDEMLNSRDFDKPDCRLHLSIFLRVFFCLVFNLYSYRKDYLLFSVNALTTYTIVPYFNGRFPAEPELVPVSFSFLPSHVLEQSVWRCVSFCMSSMPSVSPNQQFQVLK